MLLRANEQGVEDPRILNNFIDFLFIFGHFVRSSYIYHSLLFTEEFVI